RWQSCRRKARRADMSAVMPSPAMPAVLPWTRISAEERWFRRILLGIAAVFLLLSLIVPLLPVARLVAPPVEEPDKRYVRLMLEPAPTAQTTAAPEEAKAEDVTKEPEVAEAPAPQQEEAAPAPAKKPDSAREQAQSSGILAMRQSLGAMREDASAGKPPSGELSTSGGTAEKTERSVLTSEVAQDS